LEAGYLPQNKEVKMGCGSKFRYKLKKKGRGPLSRWADFFKVELSIWTLLDIPCSHWFSSSQHSLTSACAAFSIFSIFGPFFMFFGTSLLVFLLVFRNCYLKEVVANTRPWGQEITIQNCHLGFHINISSTEKNKGPSPSVYPKAGYDLIPPITSLHFFGLWPFASRCKQPLRLELYMVNLICKASQRASNFHEFWNKKLHFKKWSKRTKLWFLILTIS
jgi:hypothetical protein